MCVGIPTVFIFSISSGKYDVTSVTCPSKQSFHSQPTVTTVRGNGLYSLMSVQPFSPSKASVQWTDTKSHLHLIGFMLPPRMG